jgi:hypothetical protein
LELLYAEKSSRRSVWSFCMLKKAAVVRFGAFV